MNYDSKNEKFHLKEARSAKSRLKGGNLTSAEQKHLKRIMKSHTKSALELRTKQDKKKGVKKTSGAIEAVDKGIREANIRERSKSRMAKID